MCELLGMSANIPTDIRFSFSGLMQRGGRTGPHSDGWGIAFYDGGYGDVRNAWESDASATSRTGFSAVPNVDFGRELVDLLIAAQSFKASVEAIRTQMELDEALLDIKV